MPDRTTTLFIIVGWGILMGAISLFIGTVFGHNYQLMFIPIAMLSAVFVGIWTAKRY